ncbi:MAG: putative methyltransferase [Brevundimonas sp.]|jgi:predicted methyltransferase|uniref:class I SAM-dependent methyltransferase n=1 Tax=Brevundimonas sp. TaxID=1871086 RepID=UPI0039E6A169
MLKTLLLAAAASVTLSGCLIIAADGGERTVVTTSSSAAAYSAPAPTTAWYQAAVADTRRPAEEVARDALRHPVEMLAFIDLARGNRIADIRPGAGYFTRLFSSVVGPTGQVYAFVPNRTAVRENGAADALVASYGNVSRVNGDLDTMTFDQPLDVVFMSQEYHDFHIPGFGVDVAKMNRAVYAALKPGGQFVVIDHQGAAGTGNSQVSTLHRIEGDFLRREIEAAGFIFEGESRAVANAADDHSLNVFDDAIRGRTDQFVYRFRKPD